jgi:hypothetical protein
VQKSLSGDNPLAHAAELFIEAGQSYSRFHIVMHNAWNRVAVSQISYALLCRDLRESFGGFVVAA